MINEESINEICRQIREDGEKEIASLLEKAEKTAESIREKARSEGERLADETIKGAQAKAEAIKKKILSIFPCFYQVADSFHCGKFRLIFHRGF